MTRLSNYGRSAAEELAPFIRDVQVETRLVLERMHAWGPLLRGQTVYRKSPGVWLELPDPEKAK